MARKPRHRLNAPYVHVVNRSVRRIPIFARRTDYRAFLAVLQKGLDRHPVQLLSYCVLSNHWHLVLEPAGTGALIDFMHWVTTTHAVRWHRNHRTVGQGPVYQGRYHATPLDAPDMLVRACRYVERNALAAKLVRRAEHWPWGSLAARLRGDGELPLKPAPFLTSGAWVEHVNTELEVERIAAETTPADWRDFHYLHGPSAAEAGPRRRLGTEGSHPVENRYVPLDDAAEAPGGLAGGSQQPDRLPGVVRPADHDQADTHVERAKHLVVGDPARALQPPKHRRHRPALAIE
jgi:putative transposase